MPVPKGSKPSASTPAAPVAAAAKTSHAPVVAAAKTSPAAPAPAVETKTKGAKRAASPEPAAVAAPAPAAAPVATTETATEKKARRAPKAEAAPAAPVEAVAAPVEESATPEDSADSLMRLFEEFRVNQQRLVENMREQVKAVNEFGRQFIKERKQQLKSAGKRARKASGETKRSGGFTAHARISNELCDLIGVPHGTTMPRTQVSSKVSEYIKTNKLFNESNKRLFTPDARLGAILGPLEDAHREKGGFGYFNLQHYLARHITPLPKEEAAAAATTSA